MKRVTLEQVQTKVHKLKSKLCTVPHLYGIAVGGSLSYRGWSNHDVDLVPLFKTSFRMISNDKQWKILGKVHDILPNTINGLAVDKGFFEVVDQYGFLKNYGHIDSINEPLIHFYNYAWEFPDEIAMRPGQESIESIEIFRCKDGTY